jgi:hypothetical protein
LYRAIRRDVKEWKRRPPKEELVKAQRTKLVQDVELFAKALKDAAPELVSRERCDAVLTCLQNFASVSARADDTDFENAVFEGDDALVNSLELLHKRYG